MDAERAAAFAGMFVGKMISFNAMGNYKLYRKLEEFLRGDITCSEMLDAMDHTLDLVNNDKGYIKVLEEFAQAAELNYGNIVTHPEALPVRESSSRRWSSKEDMIAKMERSRDSIENFDLAMDCLWYMYSKENKRFQKMVKDMLSGYYNECDIYTYIKGAYPDEEQEGYAWLQTPYYKWHCHIGDDLQESRLPRDTGNDALFNIKLDNTDVVEVNSSDLSAVANDHNLRAIIRDYGYSIQELQDEALAIIAFLSDETELRAYEIFDGDAGIAIDIDPFINGDTDAMIETANMVLDVFKVDERIQEVY